ncbi:MAG: CoA-binding protein [Burkholderiales bacterium]
MNDAATLQRVLTSSRTLAVVGLSDNPARASHYVAKYMQQHGYRVVPVNPRCAEILGEKCYPDLRAIPFAVDMVDVFRNAADCPPIAHDAVAIDAKVLWLQSGIVSQEAQHIAEAAGLTVVMDRCVKVEHARWGLPV